MLCYVMLCYGVLRSRTQLINYTTELQKKLGTSTPNIKIMTLGLILKLKELNLKPLKNNFKIPFSYNVSIKMGLLNNKCYW